MVLPEGVANQAAASIVARFLEDPRLKKAWDRLDQEAVDEIISDVIHIVEAVFERHSR